VKLALALLAALAVASPAGAAAAEGELELQLEAGGGADSNPTRALDGGGTPGGFGLVLVRARAEVVGERLRFQAALDEGARLYPGQEAASALASRLEASLRVALGGGLAAEASLSARDLTERGHALDQDALHSEASLGWARGGFGAALAGGFTLFAPREATLRPFLASGPEAALRAWWSPRPEHLLSASGSVWWASYPRWGELAPGGRDDRTSTLSAEYAWRGDFLAALGYAFSHDASSTDGGDYDRHRLTARGAVLLPLELTLALRAALQWSSYPRALFLSEQLLLAAGQENQDAFEVRVTRPLGADLELALAAALYRAEAVQGGGAAPEYTRAVLSTTLVWHAGRLTSRRE
jgi:hypothetical protein